MTISADIPSEPLSQPRAAPVRGDRFAFWSACLLALLSCLPVLVARYPQMSDYPAHLARYAVMLDRAHNPWLAHWYAFEWKTTGNVGVDILIWPVSALFGVEAGARVIAGLIPPLTGLALVAIERTLRGRTGAGSLLAMALVWSPMMLIGLLNFTLGLALALWAFALWVRLEGRAWRWLWFLPIALVVWLCHMSAWGVLGVMVFGYEASRRRNPAMAALMTLPLALPLVAMLTLGGTSGEFSYGDHVWIYKQAIWLKALRDQVYELDFLSLIVVGLVLFVALAARRIDGRLGWSALILALLSWAAPRHISGGDYVDYRMITTGLMVGCLAIDFPGTGRRARWLLWAAPVLYLVRLTVTTMTWAADSAETGELLHALDQVPEGARVASAVHVSLDHWPLNHFEHIGAYAVLRRHALVNANFAVAHIHMLSLRQGGYADPSQRLLQFAAEPVDLARFKPAEKADWLWYVGDKDPVSLPIGATVVWRHGHSLLARLAKPAHPD